MMIMGIPFNTFGSVSPVYRLTYITTTTLVALLPHLPTISVVWTTGYVVFNELEEQIARG